VQDHAHTISHCYILITVPDGLVVGVTIAPMNETVLQLSDSCLGDGCRAEDFDYVTMYRESEKPRGQYVSRSNRLMARLTSMQGVHYEVRLQFTSITPGQWTVRQTSQHSGVGFVTCSAPW
jgi:hypothetical protein